MKLSYKRGYKYKVAFPFWCHLGEPFLGLKVDHPYFHLGAGSITIRKGYAWDGASGPAIDTPTFMRGSLVHDCLYQMLREGLVPEFHKQWDIRRESDKILREICLLDGMCKLRAWWVYKAVRKFGRTNVEREITTAP